MAVDASMLVARLREMANDYGQRLGEEFVSRAQQRCSRRSGDLADSIEVDSISDDGSNIAVHVIVGEDYAQYQDEGTGIFGPEGVPITPVTAKVLRFDWPAAGGIVFAHSVAGSPGTHFFSDTVKDWSNIVAAVGA